MPSAGTMTRLEPSSSFGTPLIWLERSPRSRCRWLTPISARPFERFVGSALDDTQWRLDSFGDVSGAWELVARLNTIQWLTSHPWRPPTSCTSDRVWADVVWRTQRVCLQEASPSTEIDTPCQKSLSSATRRWRCWNRLSLSPNVRCFTITSAGSVTRGSGAPPF